MRLARRGELHGAAVAAAQLVEGADHERLAHLVHLDAAADRGQQRDGELAAEVLAELREAVEDDGPAGGIREVERLVPERKPEPLEQAEHALDGRAPAAGRPPRE